MNQRGLITAAALAAMLLPLAASAGAAPRAKLPGTIAFTGGGDSSAQVFVATPNRMVRQITHGRIPTRAWGWSPDGSRLLVCRGKHCRRGFFVMRLDGSLETRVLGDLPTWSRDGSRLAYLDGAGVLVVGKDGRGGRLLASLGESFGYGASLLEEGGGTLCWTHDGSRVVVAFHREQVGLLLAIPTQSGAKRRPTQIRRSLDEQPQMSVACSPTKPKVAFADDGFIHVLSLDGMGSKRLQPGDGPTWSPDGSTIAFNGGGSLTLMDADGSDVRPLDCTCPVRNGGWSPDGSMIAYDSSDGGIYILNLDGSGGARVAYRPSYGFYAPLWRPASK